MRVTERTLTNVIRGLTDVIVGGCALAVLATATHGAHVVAGVVLACLVVARLEGGR